VYDGTLYYAGSGVFEHPSTPDVTEKLKNPESDDGIKMESKVLMASKKLAAVTSTASVSMQDLVSNAWAGGGGEITYWIMAVADNPIPKPYTMHVTGRVYESQTGMAVNTEALTNASVTVAGITLANYRTCSGFDFGSCDPYTKEINPPIFDRNLDIRTNIAYQVNIFAATYVYLSGNYDEFVGSNKISAYTYADPVFSLIGDDPDVSLQFSEGIVNGTRADVLAFVPPGGVTTGIPEPSTWAMTLAGFVGLGFVSLKRRKASLA
jgi:hypothetical protein